MPDRHEDKHWLRERSLSIIQGLFYVATGIWPVLHIPSFLAVTGPKTDLWLVQSFGLLVLAVGGLLVVLTLRGHAERTIGALGFWIAATLVWIDCYYVATGQIGRIYLADAAVEGAIAVAWLVSMYRRRRPAPLVANPSGVAHKLTNGVAR